jgi:hypothetical protein
MCNFTIGLDEIGSQGQTILCTADGALLLSPMIICPIVVLHDNSLYEKIYPNFFKTIYTFTPSVWSRCIWANGRSRPGFSLESSTQNRDGGYTI